MKIVRLDLRAFGPFRDVALDLSGGTEGLHVIYGPNEAGKSTALRALRQMLYGFPHRKSDHFLVGNSDLLRIGGTLRHTDGTELAFLRRRGNRNLLRMPDDEQPLDDSSLDRFLAGVDEDRFKTLFSLDHQELVQGGQALIEGGGLVSMLVFGAGTDLVRLRKLQKTFEEEHGKLFNPRGKNPDLNKAFGDLSEARREIEAASIRSVDWHDRSAAHEEAGHLRDRLDRELADLRRRKARLERIGQALPDVLLRDERAATLAALGDAPRLRDDFSDDRRRAEDDLRNADRARGAAGRELAEIAEALERLEPPGAILAESAAIEDLQRRLGAHGKELVAIDRLRVERETLETSARATLRDLGRDQDLVAAGAQRLTLSERQQVQILATDRRALLVERDETAKAIDEWKTTRDRAIATLDGLDVPRDVEPLHRAVQRIQRGGDLESQLNKARADLAQRERQAASALKKLRPWFGTLMDLDSLAVPSESTILTCQSAQEEADRVVTEARRLEAEAVEQVAELGRRLARLQGEGEVPGEADLDAARSRREQGWQLIRGRYLDGKPDPSALAGFAPDGDLASAYERSVAAADEAADRLRREAGRVAEKAGLLADREQATRKLAALGTRRDEAEALSRTERTRWLDLWRPAGFEPLTPREMLTWQREAAKLGEKAEAIHEARQRVEELAGRIDQHQAELSTLLRAQGEPGEAGSLDALIDRSQQFVDRARSTQELRKKLQDDHAEAEARLALALARDEAARLRLLSWSESWASALIPLGLPPETGTEIANATIEKLATLDLELGKAEAHRRRIEAFDRDAAKLADDVHALVERVAPDLAGEPWPRAVDLLNGRLASSRDAKARRDELEKRVDRLGDDLRRAEGVIDDARDRLDALAREAGCPGPSDLPEAEARSELRRAVEADCEAIDARLRKLTGGSTLDEFAAEARSFDADSLEPEVARRDDEIRQKAEALKEVHHKIGGLETELKTMEETARDARAHEAASRAQGLLAQIESAASQYVRLRLAAAVLREAIERYRERNEGPVLSRAGELFANLTCGSFARLRSQLNDRDEHVLVGVRPDGTTIGVDGMSDGTCDQLYLALKLASVENQIERNVPLPFVADDLLVNFDDARALAALHALAAVSARTQVLFFTHHSHLVDLAKSHLPPGVVFVHELPVTTPSSSTTPARP